MVNYFKACSQITIYGGLIATLVCLPLQPAQSQLIPQVWGTVGVKDEEVSYGGGVRLLNFGLEVGTGEDGATGGDALVFIDFPLVSPYVGLGIYSGDDTVAYSGGVQLRPPGNFFVGAGYHSIRGINGQIGIKFP